MELKVYSCHDDFNFHKEEVSFAEERLSTTYRRSVYYVKDKANNTICFVCMGGHISAVIFLLKKYYGLIDYKAEDINKWQDIIRNNFVIYNALFDSPKYYSEEITGDAVYWAGEVQEVE
ncbi:hypothetical protein [Streptococcus suis]|uniref:hypothetical protein n=1 Tax=Streptococcus suis TaxID=1307 RepID=UPI000462B497|nr:hypothetical protein [Streptococcus suis]MCG9913079.1 hypothetical protein [Streptococcus suis]MCG9921645.1 hypothetical protein [Streptococcus suis]